MTEAIWVLTVLWAFAWGVVVGPSLRVCFPKTLGRWLP